MSNYPLLKETLVIVDQYREDPLAQCEALNTLIGAASRISTPSCIALYGSWGAGKSVLLHSARSQWEERGNPSVWFDPWEYERQPEPLASFLWALVDQLGLRTNDEAKQMALGIAKSVVSLLGRIWAAYGLSVASPLARPLLEPLTRVKPEDFAAHFQEYCEHQDLVKAAKQRFADLVELALDQFRKQNPSAPGNRLAVFIDDLDRCLPDSAVGLIEGIKLFLAGDGPAKVVFLFALDRRIVAEAIRNRFPKTSLYTGANYLEKIFDLSLEVPPIHRAGVRGLINSWVGEGDRLDRLTKPLECELPGYEILAMVLSQPFLANPRIIKRALNRLDLLLADPHREAEIASIENQERYVRLVTWLAGAERFSSFREFFLRASDQDVGTLIRLVHGEAHLGSKSIFAEEIAQLPDIRAFVTFLFQGSNTWRPDRARSADGSSLQTIADFDHLMRRAGL